MKNDQFNSVINALKPAVVDELADAAYERRSDAALVRTQACAPTADPRPSRDRRPARRLVFATGAAAAVAATAVLAASALPGGHDDATGPNKMTSTRAFLLASAATAAKQPATHGTCWYTRTRMWQDLMPSPKPGPGVPVPADKRYRHRTYQARTASSAEDWACTLPGGTGMRFRAHGPLDIKVTFPTRKDKAGWRAAGSPPLSINGGTTASKPSTITYDRGSHLVNPDIGSHEIEWKTIARLPATKTGLETYLRRLWQQDRKGANGYVAPADFGLYVFESVEHLLMAPTTPGTRAALYRILADCPSVHVTGRIKDRDGRSGVAITAQTPDGVITQLVVDPVTAQLLDRDRRPGDRAGTPGAHGVSDYLAVERQGWVNRIGATPAS